MKEFDFKKIDAFATINSGGNPAGYVLLNSADDISVDEMQHMARELKGFVNEVGYVYRSSENQIDMKYYSSEREVDFCGHATVAIMYDLLINDTSLQQFETLKIKTNRGLLNFYKALQYLVDNKISKRFNGALQFDTAEIPTFIKHLAWLVRTNVILP